VGDASTIGPLSFFDAEVLPDGNKLVENIRNDVFVGGEDSFERFRHAGPQTAPFLRVPNAVIEVGFVGGKVRTTDSMIFIGKDREAGYAFYWFIDGTAKPISDAPINELLNNVYTPAELAAVRGQRFNWRGADCYAFEMADRTLLFQNGSWSYIDSGINGFLALGTFGYFNATLFEGTWYVVKSDGGLYKLTDGTTDSAGKFSRQIVTFARSEEESVFTINQIEMGIANGTGVDTVGLSLSRNGRIWSDIYYTSSSAVGMYDQKLVWAPIGGCGTFEDYAGIGFYTTASFDFAVDTLVMR
jgi:hypothetical protein